MPIEVALGEGVNPLLVLGVQILKLVEDGETVQLQAVWQNHVRPALEQVFGLVGGDLRDGGEHVCRVGGGAFQGIAVVDATTAGFGVRLQPGELVVKVDLRGAKMPA